MDHVKDALNKRKGIHISIIVGGKHPQDGMMEDVEDVKDDERQKLGLAPATPEAGKPDMKEKEAMGMKDMENASMSHEKEDEEELEGPPAFQAGTSAETEGKPPESPDTQDAGFEKAIMQGEAPQEVANAFEHRKPKSLGDHAKMHLAKKYK